MSKDLPGKLTISRIQSYGEEQPIRISVRDENSGTEFIEISVTYEDFASALTGLAMRPCTIRYLRGLDKVGKFHEMKKEVITLPEFVHRNIMELNRSKNRTDNADAFALLADYLDEYEVDGWRASGAMRDVTNSHNYQRNTKTDTVNCPVVFRRYLDEKPDDEPTDIE